MRIASAQDKAMKAGSMTKFKSDFLNVVHERGFVHQCSDVEALDDLLSTEVVSAYIGFDCTAPSLHVGSLLQILMLRWFQKTGHRPVPLMGGGTTQVGDPSGRDESRQILTPDKIEENKRGIQAVFDQFLSFGDGPTDAKMIDNADWLMTLNYVDFLRSVGRHFSVNQMIARESVKQRLDREQHLSFLEFNYMCLQGYDFVELYRREGIRLQLGGSDQWGNILSGIELGRRMEQVELFALTSPLITTASGAKMGKTAAGAIWLNPDLLSPYEYWQFWRNTEDGDVERFLKLFTELPLAEISRLAALGGQEVNEAKKVLATEATAMLHGRSEAETAAETARQTFEEGALSEDLPTVEIAASGLSDGLGLLSLVVEAGLAKTNSEARRHVQGGAIRLNDNQATDPRYQVSSDDLDSDGTLKLSFGKKVHKLVKPV